LRKKRRRAVVVHSGPDLSTARRKRLGRGMFTKKKGLQKKKQPRGKKKKTL